MRIKNWNVKDIYFFPNEREGVAKMVNRLLSRGQWELFAGEIKDGEAWGDMEGDEDNNFEECIQLHK